MQALSTDGLNNRNPKPLHVGTYEAAIENMLRRMDDQPEGADGVSCPSAYAN